MKTKSPFRYPGSKSRLLEWILPQIPESEDAFIDVFCGGGSVFLAVAEREKSRNIIINDSDPFIADFWKTVICDSKIDILVNHVNQHIPSIETYECLQNERLGNPTNDVVYNGFLALVINRMAFSGIAMSGAIGGVTQKSKYDIACRWNAESLIKSIYEAHFLLKDRTVVYSLDFRDLFNIVNKGFYYIDPPYFKQGSALYPFYLHLEDHIHLAEILEKRRNWLLSYDGCQEIYDLYQFADIDERNEHSMLARKKKKEVLIKPKNE